MTYQKGEYGRLLDMLSQALKDYRNKYGVTQE
jgi:hypothetical protein